MSFFSTVVRRLLGLCAAVLLSSFAVFLVPFVSEGDPIRNLLRARIDVGAADDATISAYAAQYGLHDPMWIQFLRWLGRFFTGDMGISYISGTPVIDRIASALGITLLIVGLATVLAIVSSLALGTISAIKEDRWPDRIITSLTHGLIAVPEYAIAPLLVLLLSVKLALLPSAGLNSAASLVIPVLVLSLRPISFFTAAVRSGMLEALRSEHCLAARARGVSRQATIFRHVIPHGLLPLWTMVGLWFAGLLGGSVIIEVIFAIPGMGRLIYDSIINSDIPMAQGGVVVVVICAVVVTTMVDIIQRFSDPNLRRGLKNG